MATSLATFSAFALNNRPANLEINRNGAVNFNGASLPSVVSQNWIPSIDNTYDLGENSTPRRWRDLWISRNISAVGSVTAGALTVANNAIFTNGNVYIGGNGLSNYNSNTPNIGTNGSGRWGALWITTINTTGLVTAAAINVSSLAVTGTQPALFSGFVLPSNAGALDLGSSGLPWRDLYITGNVYKNGAVYNPGLGALGDLIPAANNTYNVGNTSFRWKDARFDGNIYCGSLFALNNIEATQGNLNVYNGYGNFGGSLTVGSAGSGDITVSGSVIVSGNPNSVRPFTNQNGSVGTSGQQWGDIYAVQAHISTVIPVLTGQPSAGTSMGTNASRYQVGYVQTMNTDSMVPYTNNSGSVGSASLVYAAGYFNNLYLSALPTSSFLASGTSTPPTPTTTGTPGFALTGTTNFSTLFWMRVGSIYTVSYKWKITVSAGWTAFTNYTTIRVTVNLPFTRDTTQLTFGECSGGAEDFPCMFGSVAPGSMIDSDKFIMSFYDATLSSLAVSGNVVTFQCVFQCIRTAA